MTTTPRIIASLVPLALLLACDTESDQVTFQLQAHSFANSEWSEPVNLGPPINTAFNEQAATLSKDELSLYFASNRPGTMGANDLWVSRRACLECPWEDPVNLGPNINSDRGDGGANFSDDGHVMFFSSGRPGGHGAADIWMSRRADPKDDLGWGPAVNLGPEVNTATAEAGPAYRENAEGGPVLYFDRGMLPALAADIYYVPVTRHGEIHGPAVLVSEFSVPNANDAGVTIRTDGREAFFWSFGPGRPEAVGGGDLFRSARKSVHDPWSAPELLEPPLNTEFADIKPTLSFDGRTLLFWSGRPGGVGAFDIYKSTRTPSGK